MGQVLGTGTNTITGQTGILSGLLGYGTGFRQGMKVALYIHTTAGSLLYGDANTFNNPGGAETLPTGATNTYTLYPVPTGNFVAAFDTAQDASAEVDDMYLGPAGASATFEWIAFVG